MAAEHSTRLCAAWWTVRWIRPHPAWPHPQGVLSMHLRRTGLVPILLLSAAGILAACGPAGSSPAVGDQTATPTGLSTAPASMAPGGSVAGDAMAAFCQAWTTDVAANW